MGHKALTVPGCPCPHPRELTGISLPKAIRIRFDCKFGLVWFGLPWFCIGFLFSPDCFGFFLAPVVFFQALPRIVFYNFLKIQSKYCIRRCVPKAQRELSICLFPRPYTPLFLTLFRHFPWQH